MFGEIAVALLRLTEHSGTVPSVILARDIPASLDRRSRLYSLRSIRRGGFPLPPRAGPISSAVSRRITRSVRLSIFCCWVK